MADASEVARRIAMEVFRLSPQQSQENPFLKIPLRTIEAAIEQGFSAGYQQGITVAEEEGNPYANA